MFITCQVQDALSKHNWNGTMPRITRSKKAISKILVAAAAILIIVVATAAVYYGTLPATTSKSPAPTPSPTLTVTPTQTPTQTSTTLPSPTSNTTAIENFAAGKTANYITKQYNSTTGSLDLEIDVNYTLIDYSFDGSPAWLWNEISNTVVDNVTYEFVNSWSLNKTDLSALHLASLQIVNNTFSGSYETSSVTSVDTAIQQIDPATYTGIEDVTVPAGTFTNCIKAVTTEDSDVITTWIRADVPFWGIVKQQITTNNILTLSIELSALG
jgi:hypothetical protein